MLTVAALVFLGAPSKGFTIVRDSVAIEKVTWYDAEGEKRVTEEPQLVIRLKVTNNGDHTMRWPGFNRAQLTFGTRYVGGSSPPVALGRGCRWEGSLVADQELKAGQASTILLIYKLPAQRGPASLRMRWNGESPGVHITVNNKIEIPADK